MRWREDQSIKWARVDFLAPAAAKDAIFEFGRNVARRQSEARMWRRPDTDKMPLPIKIELLDAQGKTYRDVVDNVELEETDPVKGVLKITGHHATADGNKLWRSPPAATSGPNSG